MGHAARMTTLSARDFMAWDATRAVRHEFVRGEVHVTAALNVAMALRRHLHGTPCRTFIDRMKLRVEAADAYDRGDKFAAYRRLPTLREYLLAAPDSRRCDLYRKGDDGLWVLHPFEPGQTGSLATVALELAGEVLGDEVTGSL